MSSVLILWFWFGRKYETIERAREYSRHSNFPRNRELRKKAKSRSSVNVLYILLNSLSRVISCHVMSTNRNAPIIPSTRRINANNADSDQHVHEHGRTHTSTHAHSLRLKNSAALDGAGWSTVDCSGSRDANCSRQAWFASHEFARITLFPSTLPGPYIVWFFRSDDIVTSMAWSNYSCAEKWIRHFLLFLIWFR